MITKEQAVKLGSEWYSRELHYTGHHACTIKVGPWGEREYNITVTVVRVSGKCKTWERDPGRFRLPVKYSLYELFSFYIDQDNCADFHLTSECEPRTIYSDVLQAIGGA